MNLSPTEMDRLVVFSAAELARRHKSLGVKLSHPEAVALITDEVMTAARRDIPIEEIRDMAGRLLSTDDVMPGVAEMIPLIYIEGAFAEGTKVVAIFEPIRPGKEPVAEAIVPGEIITPDEELRIFDGMPVTTIEVVNTGDRDTQVRSHSHFFEANRALKFDRAAAFGKKIDRPSGTGIRFEPGIPKLVDLVPIDGARTVLGQAGLVNGPLDAPGAAEEALKRARAAGYLGA
jgi:urease subunit gamma/beta